MEKIIVNVSWCNKNFGASFSENVPGAAVFTAKTFEELQREAQETLDFHMQGYIEDGEAPQWYLDHNYEFEYNFLDAATLLHIYSPDLTLSAISRATGINQTQLSHYANGVKTPRPAQRQRIIDGLHAIGRRLMAAR